MGVCNVTLALQTLLAMYTKMLSQPPPHIHEKPPVMEEYDFIIVGGGSAGCVVANRLSEVSEWKVLLLEAGDDEPFVTRIPGLMYNSGFYNTALDWNYTAILQNGKTHPYSRARMLGGCSAHNFMLYVRGSEKVYDQWNDLGDYGWDYESVLPYFMKSEDIRAPDFVKDVEHHSQGGYLTVERFPYRGKNVNIMIKALHEAGFYDIDVNGNHHEGHLSTSRNGQRLSVNAAFLEPVRDKRPNLHVVTNAMVTKVIIDPSTKTALGVEVVLNGDKSSKVVIKANKEVILTAGFVGSPRLLELSGIGLPEVLDELGIEVIQELPVGENYLDHLTVHGPLLILNKTSTLPSSCQTLLNDMDEYTNKRRGPFSSQQISLTYSFASSSRAEDDIPDLLITFAPIIQGLGDEASHFMSSYSNAIQMWVSLYIVEGRGTVHINSTSPFDAPIIRPFFSSSDIEAVVEGLMKAQHVSESKTFTEAGITVNRTQISDCQKFKYGTMDYWLCMVENSGVPMSHGCGTCKMGPKYDDTAVVDPELKVRGIENLRVMDVSVSPTIINANTNVLTIMIAEKGSDMVKSSWEDNSYRK